MIESVIRASNLLCVDELELFNLAYQYWYAIEAEPREIYKIYTQYMHKKIAPPWAIHYARSVLGAYQSGNFDPTMFGIQPKTEELPLLCSLIFKIPRTYRLNEEDYLLVA